MQHKKSKKMNLLIRRNWSIKMFNNSSILSWYNLILKRMRGW